MKKIKNIVIGGIQTKVFNLVLVVVILMAAVFSVVVIVQSGKLSELVNETNEQQKTSISRISGETMDAVVKNSLSQSTAMEAYIADNMFADLASNVQMLSDYAEKLLSDPDAVARQSYSGPDAEKDGQVSIQLLTEKGVDVSNPDISKKLGVLANMSDMMSSIYSTGRVNACYVTLTEGAMLLADDHSADKFDEKGNVVNIPVHERSWFNGAVETGELYFTDVEQDVFSGNVSIMCSCPVYVKGKIVAVAGADLYLNSMADTVNSSDQNGSFVCIINEQGHVIFSPVEEGIFKVRMSSDATDLRDSDETELSQFLNDALEGTQEVKLVEVEGSNYYMSAAKVETLNWIVLSVVSQEVTEQPTLLLQQQYDDIQAQSRETLNTNLQYAKWTMIVLVVIVLILGIVGALILSKRIVKPLESITKRVGSLGGSDLQFKMADEYKTGDEIEILAESFANLSEKTLRYFDEMTRVTAEKERIGVELDMATGIQASQLPRLFPAFPSRKEFDIFASMTPAKEVGGDFYDFFLVDDDHIAMVMADVSGKGVPAALFMMVSRVLIKSRVQNGESPATALSNVNEQLCENNDTGLFVTVWLGILEISTGKGIAANAGHEHPAIKRKGGQYELALYKHSPAVALMEGIPFKEHEFELNPGDSLFVYTDGVAEATNADKELFGTDRMLKALNKDPKAEPKNILQNVMDGINDFVKDAEQFDDITMLCLEYNGPDGKNNV